MVDNTFFNVMSYHQAPDRLTSLQFDRMTHTSNELRREVASGDTILVDRSPTPTSTGSMLAPFSSIEDALAIAGKQDIVLIRGGDYSGALTLSTPTHLRASRGDVTIGN